ncbi:MAG: hypothetical protein SFW62_00575 [Alphaproteobacteria bacterium]|nr:hypothetical protein [Alphaproteobacteria bacterium]
MAINLAQYTKQLASGLEKLASGGAKTLAGGGAPKDEKKTASSTTMLARTLTGSIGALDEYYFPSEIIGGTCPRVAGEEEDIVWNAAAEACDTERVHVVWQSVENRIWYLAVRSSELASHPNTWCPFASLLPGMKEAATPPVCYTYYSDETATMMTIAGDSLQIYRGTTLVVRAKAERTARELGNAPVIELVPDRIMQLTPIPWYSVSLFEDRARRILAATSVLGALGLAALALLVWLLVSASLLSARHDLSSVKERTDEKALALMKTADSLRATPMREQLAKFSDLNDGLLAINGFLEIYEIKENKTRWRAIIPPNVTADRINALGGKTLETTPQGVAIGNNAQAEYEASGKGKK